jgi:hypothetical protein
VAGLRCYAPREEWREAELLSFLLGSRNKGTTPVAIRTPSTRQTNEPNRIRRAMLREFHNGALSVAQADDRACQRDLTVCERRFSATLPASSTWAIRVRCEKRASRPSSREARAGCPF